MKPLHFYLLALSLYHSLAYAAEIGSPLSEFIHLYEIGHEQCSVRDSKMIMVKSSNTEQMLEIQLDRYFMDIRQAGRSVVVLRPGTDAHQMGCSRVLASRQMGCSEVLADNPRQSWKVVQIKIIKE